MPVNSINALLQTRDGYIWIATYDGLVRFDGVRFTVFNSSNSPGLPNSRITDLWETRDGALWLGIEQKERLVRFQGGVFTHFGSARGLPHEVMAIHEDSRGRLWVGTDAGLGFIEGERFRPVAADAISGRVLAIRERHDGSIWAALEGGRLVRLAGGVVTPVVADRRLADDGILARSGTSGTPARAVGAIAPGSGRPSPAPTALSRPRPLASGLRAVALFSLG